MIEELYFDDILQSVKYNKTLNTALYLQLNSHLKLYISYKVAAVL